MSTKQIFVKTLSGQTLTLDVSDEDKITDIKKKIQAKNQIPFDQQRLIFNGKELDNSKTIQDYEVDKASTLHLVIRLK